jgi:excisionase family DNA binding protein
MEKLLTRKEAAEILGIGLAALDRARAKGVIAYIQYVEGGSVYFKEEALQDFIARSTHQARPQDNIPTYRKIRGAARA